MLPPRRIPYGDVNVYSCMKNPVDKTCEAKHMKYWDMMIMTNNHKTVFDNFHKVRLTTVVFKCFVLLLLYMFDYYARISRSSNRVQSSYSKLTHKEIKGKQSGLISLYDI